MLYRVHASGLTTACKYDPQDQRRSFDEASPDRFKAPPRLPRQTEVVGPWINLGPVLPPTGRNLLLALPFLTVGGADTLFFTLVQGLVQRGYHVIVITTIALPETMTEEATLFDSVTRWVYHLPKLFHDREYWPEFLRYLLRRYAIDTIMIAGCEFVYHMLPEIEREYSRIRIVDQLFNDTGHIVNNRRYTDSIDLNIVPSGALADSLIQKYGEKSEKVKVVPHGVQATVPAFNTPAEAFAASGLT